MDEKFFDGKRIIVTRPKERAKKTAEKLIKAGADVVFYPVTEYEELDDSFFKSAAKKLCECRWLIFTSAFAVNSFCKWAEKNATSDEKEAFFKLKTACVGKATAKKAEKYGLSPLYPKEENAVKMAEMIIESGGGDVLWVCGEKRSKEPERFLKEHGTACFAMPIYATETVRHKKTAEELLEFSEREYVLFMSGSAADGFYENCRDKKTFSKINALCMGESSANKCRIYNAKCIIKPDTAV